MKRKMCSKIKNFNLRFIVGEPKKATCFAKNEIRINSVNCG